jgi:hypothetical protein
MGQQGRKIVVLTLLFLLNQPASRLGSATSLAEFLVVLGGTEGVVGTLVEGQLEMHE